MKKEIKKEKSKIITCKSLSSKIKEIPSKKTKTSLLITRDIAIAKMVNEYPNVVNMLVTEWGFHCVSCYISNFETFEDGARVHGIVGDDFEVMLKMCNEIANIKKIK